MRATVALLALAAAVSSTVVGAAAPRANIIHIVRFILQNYKFSIWLYPLNATAPGGCTAAAAPTAAAAESSPRTSSFVMVALMCRPPSRWPMILVTTISASETAARQSHRPSTP